MEHGTRAMYVGKKCKCEPCRAANRAYQRSRGLVTYESSYVDPGPSREHIRNLRMTGMGTRTIAHLAGLSRTTVQNIEKSNKTGKPAAKVSWRTEHRLLAVRPVYVMGRSVQGHGTARRLQALVAIGWSQAYLASRLGWAEGNFTTLLKPTPVKLSTAWKVRQLYEELSSTPGPSVRARNHAVKRGYLPPAAWDDDYIDDPETEAHP